MPANLETAPEPDNIWLRFIRICLTEKRHDKIT